ncbi:hypothetical protein AMJ40_07275 [candidate division TA06 bacterium DG_26]|uniref:Uncharacterized protein n=1 Tax=candidate division TA06 bacterium DG_26 TaxID=1703771 RepID=A0A0S7WG04_UNCT6|nr:MAG: hypothetical protein AMJ40_07275 [candidate division TA06 bacterium DG_26]
MNRAGANVLQRIGPWQPSFIGAPRDVSMEGLDLGRYVVEGLGNHPYWNRLSSVLSEIMSDWRVFSIDG